MADVQIEIKTIRSNGVKLTKQMFMQIPRHRKDIETLVSEMLEGKIVPLGWVQLIRFPKVWLGIKDKDLIMFEPIEHMHIVSDEEIDEWVKEDNEEFNARSDWDKKRHAPPTPKEEHLAKRKKDRALNIKIQQIFDTHEIPHIYI